MLKIEENQTAESAIFVVRFFELGVTIANWLTACQTGKS